MAGFTADDVAAFLGKPWDAATQDQAATALTLVTGMARSYTRDQGFTNGEPADDIWTVIFTATLRLMGNKTQLEQMQVKGPFSTEFRSAFTGFSVAETMVLNRYRKRAE